MTRAVMLLAVGATVIGAVYLARRRMAGGESSQVPDLIESVEVGLSPSTYIPASVDNDTASKNLAAFLQTLKVSEGTASQDDAYRVCFGYSHTINDLSDHPYFTGEWQGAQFTSNGKAQLSTAAGAYQINRITWGDVRQADFGPSSQDAAAVALIRRCGALSDVQAGRFAAAVDKCRRTWASLPGAGYGQPENTLSNLAAAYQAAGGTLA